MYSPFIFSGSTIRPLFVIYQLLQAFRYIHNQGLFIGPFTSSDISVNENLWIEAIPTTWKRLHDFHKQGLDNHNELQKQTHSVEFCNRKVITLSQDTASPLKLSSNSSSKSNRRNLSKNLTSLVRSWVDGNISNFDYLMELNKVSLDAFFI